MEHLVLANQLTKVYDGVKALDGLSFSLKPGKVLGLLGPNGAGKTTALHIFLGLLAPSSGEALVLGLSPQDSRHEIAKKINFTSAYVQVPSNLKVIENLTIFAKLYQTPEPQKRIDELLTLFNMQNLKNRVTGALSSGEKTRLNLCKCLLNDPVLLFLDEPTASLDPEMADQVRRILKEVRKQNQMGMIYTSHNMAEVEEMCDEILFLSQGRMIAKGSRDELLDQFKAKSLDEVFIKIARSD